MSRSIGFIGAGQMAEALARGFVDKGVAQADNMWCTDPAKERKDLFASFGVHAVDSADEVSDMRLLAWLLGRYDAGLAA